MNIDTQKAIQFCKFAIPALLLGALVFHAYGQTVSWHETAAVSPDSLTPLDHVLGWAGKTIITAFLCISIPLLIIGSIRNAPRWLQEWMMPNVNELDHAAKEIEKKQAGKHRLDDDEYRLLSALAVSNGLTVLAVMVFAGLALAVL